jgi:ATP synthase protein I
MNDSRKQTRDTRHNEEFHEMVKAKADRKLRARHKRERSFWFGLGTIGMVGWSIAIPAVVGALAGRWIDAKWPGPISWTLVLLLIGLVAGCLNAWRWVEQELKDMEQDRKERDDD